MDGLKDHCAVGGDGLFAVWCDKGIAQSHEHRLIAVVVPNDWLHEVPFHVHHLKQKKVKRDGKVCFREGTIIDVSKKNYTARGSSRHDKTQTTAKSRGDYLDRCVHDVLGYNQGT